MAVTTQRADVAALTDLARALERDDRWVRSRAVLLKRRDVCLLAALADGRSAGYILVRTARRGRRVAARRLLRWLWCGAVPEGPAVIQPHSVGLIDELVLVGNVDEETVVTALWQAAVTWLQSQGSKEAQTSVAADAAHAGRWQQLGFRPMQTIIEWHGQ